MMFIGEYVIQNGNIPVLLISLILETSFSLCTLYTDTRVRL